MPTDVLALAAMPTGMLALAAMPTGVFMPLTEAEKKSPNTPTSPPPLTTTTSPSELFFPPTLPFRTSHEFMYVFGPIRELCLFANFNGRFAGLRTGRISANSLKGLHGYRKGEEGTCSITGTSNKVDVSCNCKKGYGIQRCRICYVQKWFKVLPIVTIHITNAAIEAPHPRAQRYLLCHKNHGVVDFSEDDGGDQSRSRFWC